MIKIKKCILIFVSFLAILSISGCSGIIKKEKKEVLIPEYTIENLPNGIFVKDEDTFYEPYNKNKTYSNLPENTTVDRLLWYTDNHKHVPVYKNSSQIVYRNSNKIPTQFVIEGFEHICDSMGIRSIRLNATGRYVISNEDSLHNTSDAFTKLSPFLSEGTIILDNIDGSPIQNSMINKTGSISGLEKGKTYTLGFFIGTQYYEVAVKVDTEIYCSKSINTITQYEMTKKGYLIWQMPELLTPGLYDLNNTGIVDYKGVTQN